MEWNMKFGCPDPECHRNLNDLRKDMKILQTVVSNLRTCVLKRVKRWELWLITAFFIGVISPIAYGIIKDSIKDNRIRDAKIVDLDKKADIAIEAYNKDIASIKEKICLIQEQQKNLPTIVYEAVKQAIRNEKD